METTARVLVVRALESDVGHGIAPVKLSGVKVRDTVNAGVDMDEILSTHTRRVAR